jgi:hypothetical protein
MKRKLTYYLATVVLLGILGFFAGSLLVRDNPQRSDAIVVLDGDSLDERYQRGMSLLRAGYGKHLFLDTNDESHFYGHKPTEYAANFLKEDAGEMLPFVSVCPYNEDSTIAETIYVNRCLRQMNPVPRSVLLVTSDWHSARALSVFRNKLPQYQWSMASASDIRLFGPHWWRHREWAKTALEEWVRVAWWNVIDRWR